LSGAAGASRASSSARGSRGGGPGRRCSFFCTGASTAGAGGRRLRGEGRIGFLASRSGLGVGGRFGPAGLDPIWGSACCRGRHEVAVSGRCPLQRAAAVGSGPGCARGSLLDSLLLLGLSVLRGVVRLGLSVREAGTAVPERRSGREHHGLRCYGVDTCEGGGGRRRCPVRPEMRKSGRRPRLCTGSPR
jgi:hypothetical protein